jgi:uncharacterized repeat protein (TIGR03833 family)
LFVEKNYSQKTYMEGNFRKNIKPGTEVLIIQKKDQGTDNFTEGFVKRILTNSSNHPHGIKVLLETGEVGRVKKIIDSSD